ncbi:5-methyl-dCTP pyrophosphohydrolase [Altererythrobacter epoxidivorans]|uniref:8-oxo-dGTP diphosphatase n=1 Tax=Altererythrobacter epoxidivorans TaxID=361183 RepID=A0A0M3TA10_9SPHN|nr:5-methyl-dCTP pyrophosphohydrolase [Altererythrobacter epoxidivorans]
MDDSGRWLMHRRPHHKHHGGLWEFPGGKVESGENPCFALVRELAEELGIEVNPMHCEPCGFAHDMAENGGSGIVILLYTIRSWSGVPAALEGGAIDWFEPVKVGELEKPPLDVALAARLFEKEGR